MNANKLPILQVQYWLEVSLMWVGDDRNCQDSFLLWDLKCHDFTLVIINHSVKVDNIDETDPQNSWSLTDITSAFEK